ncbi:MAG: hypothetical protein F6K09_05730 [Merismopedia sp. SIO2A8]|nr:hypothetical protein [Merismopedia sp. SIO2A8]
MSSPSIACPHCRKPIAANAIACPHCRTSLKAMGHAGIPLYQAAEGEVLCDTCTYHRDDSCNYPLRPQAKDCTMYVDDRKPVEPSVYHSTTKRRASLGEAIANWVQQNTVLALVICLVVVSLFMTLTGG